ncbi:MAG: lipase family protein [Sulfuricellaceae bacterium]|nr:lipase family protein [Sulfuricellaceae bacterium]
MEADKPPAEPPPQEAEETATGATGEIQARALTDKGRRIRQAVVVIHGIGEQRPMDTLRGFVEAVLADDPAHGVKYRNKPDAMNESFEMRCLQAPGNKQARRPLTDFYEYYWAHHMQGSKYTQVLSWLIGLMRRHPETIPPALRPAYFASWSVALFAAGLWVWGLIAAGAGHAAFLTGIWQQKWLFASGLAAFAAQWIGSHIVLGYVADAARYLTPSPDNIEARNKIRSEGIALLRNLHASGKYRRIVVVGHSLGAVIGYDIIRNLWVDLRKPAFPYPRKQTELKGFAEEAKTMEEGEATPAKIETFQQSQHRLWQEFVKVGVPWRVTDFVTLGAPLAHAQLLMADNPEDFARKKAQYEYPCCPPSAGDNLYYRQQYRLSQGGSSLIRNVAIPHHGAPFSCIRWSNLYFPYRRLIFGDLIGGPLNGVFGKGIRDIAVEPSTDKCLDRSLLSHVRYWTDSGKASLDPAWSGGKPSLETLRKALKLDFLRGKSAKAEPSLGR